MEGLSLDGLGGFSAELSESLLAGIEGGSADFTLLFKLVNNSGVLPADLRAKSGEESKLAPRVELEDTEGGGDDNALNLVIGGRNSFKDLQVSQGSGTTGGLVRQHSADGSPENAGGVLEVNRTLLGVCAVLKQIDY